MKNSPATFNFGTLQVRTIDKDNEVWFVASDVCAVLDIANSRDAVSRLDEDEKGVGSRETAGGLQDVTIISESGLYDLIFTSRKDAAKAFKRWVTHEVLPSIRKTGSYQLQAELKLAQAATRAAEDTVTLLELDQASKEALKAEMKTTKVSYLRAQIANLEKHVKNLTQANKLLTTRSKNESNS